jgi:probable DNA repair protein
MLDESLCPSARLGAQPPRPYNLSLGRPLADMPVIHAALLLLSMLLPVRPEFNALSQMLCSPFMGGSESEMAARTRLELRLREFGEQLALERMMILARHQTDVPQLVAALESALEWKRQQPPRQLPSAWARGFANTLRLFGWPGERTPDSAEHQTLDAFRDLLGELAQLDAFSGALDLGEALSRLTRLAAQRLFQPATEDVPVQVMGVLEASGLRFDHLWIAGWSDAAWPASPRPHPLIPASVQRRNGMPHSSAQHELEFAQQLTARLLASAPEVIVSAPQRDADQELRPSPLIAGLSEVKIEAIPQRDVPSSAAYLLAAALPLEILDDDCGPALTRPEVHGGTAVLKSQAACAFQAFAQFRLGATPMTAPGPGLDRADRGSLLHKVLSRIFAELRDHAAIAALDAARQEAVLTACVDAEIRQAHAKRPEIFSAQFAALERERLLRLLREWLVIERARAPFTVEQREYPRAVNLGPLQLTTRVDRLDRLADGRHAVIDYKTGDVNPSAWQSDRPDEPQLPCYAVTASEPVAAVLFGVLRPGDTGYRGYAQHAGTVPGAIGFDELKHSPDGCDSWEALLAHWRAVLTRLAEDYAGGAAQVAPKDRNRTCRLCHLAPLCRIDEVQALGEADDD